MADYVEREAAIAAIKKDIMGGLNYESILKRIPSEDVQPVVHGRWNATHESGLFSHPDSITYVCSECGKQFYTLYSMPPLSNYCPNCGARMDGEE